MLFNKFHCVTLLGSQKRPATSKDSIALKLQIYVATDVVYA